MVPPNIIADQWTVLVAYWNTEDAKNEYNRKLSLVKPVEDQKLTTVKDRVFHDVIGEDGHGYCRTYGSTVPRNLVYPQEPSGIASNNDLVAKITEEVTEKLKESFDKKLEDAIKMLQAQIANNMDCTIAHGGRNIIAHRLVPPNATSGHEARRESIGEGDAEATAHFDSTSDDVTSHHDAPA